ncbi:MAG: hypothetical protein G01um10143_470 [Parcubacteria group bacterium Gr01-1014_3]|nr:MAG: hypothetical protein G01um10143_470 [Parcubacteria group bacterium Gr01-1014_3]
MPKIHPEKQEVIVRHPEPIKIPKRFTKPPEKKMAPTVEKKMEKDALDKVLDILEDAENKLIKEGPVKLAGKGLRKSSEVLVERPIKNIFSGVWEGIKKMFSSTESETMAMPKGSTIETEAENVLDLSRSGATRKELKEEVGKIEKQGLTTKEKEVVAFNRLKQKKGK